MKKWFKRLTVVLLLTIIVVAGLLYEGDLPREVVDAKYASPTSQFLVTDSGARIHYRDEGNADGRAVVLIHGSNASLHTWEPWVRILGDKYRLITLDLPAHGLTGSVPDRDYSTAGQLKTVEAIVTHLKLDRFVLGGNSMGGGVTWRYTLQHPDQVEGMILVDAVGLPQWSMRPRANAATKGRSGPAAFRLLRQPWFRAVARYMDPRRLVRQGLVSAYADESTVPEEVVQRYCDLTLREGSREAILDRFESVGRRSQESVDPQQFTQPTLVLWGRQDALIPVEVGEKFDE
ncbi:MAG: alpha/beta hydrolase, partial [Fuerstiella sp.]|nr:alpha/beta hydrolase [Fuerstiella sp.]